VAVSGNILALDVSTRCIGVVILNEEEELLFSEAWRFENKKRFPSIYDKAEFVKEKLKEMSFCFYRFFRIYIEEPTKMFKTGFSSADTIAILQFFNGVVSWLCYDAFFIKPKYLMASSVRKKCGIKVPRGVNPKPLVLDYFIKKTGFEYKLTPKGNPVSGTYDIADAYALAKAALTIT